MSYGYIYKTTNKKDGRIYIGQNSGRFKSGYLGSGKHLKLALQKYGKPAFRIEVIAFAKNAQELDELEKKFICEYRRIVGIDGLYNIASGGRVNRTFQGKLNPMFGSHRIGKQNPNYKDGHTLIKKYCCDCGKLIRFSSTRCSPCANKDTAIKNKSGFTSEHFSSMAKKRIAPWNKGLKLRVGGVEA